MKNRILFQSNSPHSTIWSVSLLRQRRLFMLRRNLRLTAPWNWPPMCVLSTHWIALPCFVINTTRYWTTRPEIESIVIQHYHRYKYQCPSDSSKTLPGSPVWVHSFPKMASCTNNSALLWSRVKMKHNLPCLHVPSHDDHHAFSEIEIRNR